MFHLRDGDSTLFGKFLFGFFTGVGVGQVGVEILIQDFCGLFAEVAPFASGKKEADYFGFFKSGFHAGSTEEQIFHLNLVIHTNHTQSQIPPFTPVPSEGDTTLSLCVGFIVGSNNNSLILGCVLQFSLQLHFVCLPLNRQKNFSLSWSVKLKKAWN